MCSIFGGSRYDSTAQAVIQAASDRGRDASTIYKEGSKFIGTHRATPTTEEINPKQLQPFGREFKVVHNGTVENDKELGAEPGHIDSKVFENMPVDTLDMAVSWLDRKVRGSFALAVMKPGEFFLICNYKPLHYAIQEGELYFASMARHLTTVCDSVRRVPPYTALCLKVGQYGYEVVDMVELKREQPNHALVVCSGGLDSTAVTGWAKNKFEKIALLHYDYQCKATDRERQAVEEIAKALECPVIHAKLPFDNMQGGSGLFSSKEIDNGKEGAEYGTEWVPARNLIMLAHAVGYAEANNFGHIVLGTNLEESSSHPDNEEQFIADYNTLLELAVQNGRKVEIHDPVGRMMKKEIVTFAVKHRSPIAHSYSCYNGREKHCGKCGSCYMRKRAFLRAGVHDPTEYES